MFYVIFFLYGIIIGSFLNVCIYRIPNKVSIIKPPSACPQCKEYIKWYDNIPILSYILLRGRCRFCNEKISIRYMLVELFSGLLLVYLYYVYGLSWHLLFVSIISFALVVITFIDLKHMLIPDKLVIFVLVTGIAYELILRPVPLLDALIGFFAVSVPLYLLAVITKGGIGGGDIKLMAVVGIFLGWKGVLAALILGAGVGAIVSIITIILKIKKRKDMIPFGPFLCAGILAALIYGNQIINWYIGVFSISY